MSHVVGASTACHCHITPECLTGRGYLQSKPLRDVLDEVEAYALNTYASGNHCPPPCTVDDFGAEQFQN